MHIIEIIGLVFALASDMIAYKTLRRTPKLSEPPYNPSVIAFTVGEAQKPRGLFGNVPSASDAFL